MLGEFLSILTEFLSIFSGFGRFPGSDATDIKLIWCEKAGDDDGLSDDWYWNLKKA